MPKARRRAEESREKVIVRSNGVVTYIGKDLANQFWKLGLLGLDFNYRRFATQENGRPLWSTTSGAGEPGAPEFGHAKRIYNVIDSRQMYLQALLSQALRTLGHVEEAENSIHFSYEMVALSHATAKELGYNTPQEGDEAAKPFVEVSGRKGLGVKIDDLLDLLGGKATAEVAKRNPDVSQEECERVGAQIAVAAIRYFMLKYLPRQADRVRHRGGPELRGRNRSVPAVRGGAGQQHLPQVAGTRGVERSRRARRPRHDPGHRAAGSAEAGAGGDHALWAVVFEASRLDEIVEQVVRSLEFSGLAKYTFGLAQTFNAFYHRYPILNEEQADRKRWRAAGVAYVRTQLTKALDLMGIEVPSRM